MAKENDDRRQDQDEEEFIEEVTAEEEPEEQASEQPDQAEGAEDIIGELKKKYDELNEKYLRLYADYDNFKKRSSKERTDALNYAAAPIMEKLLPVLDNFERALAACEEETPFTEGVRMVSRQLEEILEAEGLTGIDAEGNPFDPMQHNAVMVDNDETKEDNVVTAELQKGYRYKDRVIRPSMVKVNKLS